MKELNLYKLWQVCNTLSEKQSELCEQSIYVYLLGHQSSFSAYTFENFLSYYSFKIEDGNIIVFNTDGIPYEDFRNNDISHIPTYLLSFSAEKIEKYMEEEIEKQLKQQEEAKIQEKEDIKRQIELLQKQLEND